MTFQGIGELGAEIAHKLAAGNAHGHPRGRLKMRGRVMRLALAIAGVGIGCAFAAHAGPLTLQGSFLNPSPNDNDLFGAALSLSGGKALIGAPLDGTTGTGSGRAYVFDATTGALLRTLENPTPAANDQFGLTVSLSGNLALVGAQNDGTGAAGAGAAYLFNATTGSLLRTFTDPGPSPILLDNFGHAVAVSGNRALISAIGDDLGATNAGVAYLFDTTTGALLRTFQNPTPQSGDNFGVDVALFGDRALISTTNDDTAATNAGAAYLFDTTTGTLLKTFLNPTPELNNQFGNNDNFGAEVALSGTKALIGAPNESVNGFHNGAAYLYDLATGNLLHTLLIPTPNSDTEEFLGQGIALSDDYALAGAPFRNKGPATSQKDLGAEFLFDANTGAFLQEIVDPVPNINDRFGFAAAVDGHDVVIGAQTDLIGTIRPGQVFYYAGPNTVPEPGTLLLLAVGLAAGRRRIVPRS
jgi:outer membrane protein assembly factor BamB